VNEMKQRTKRTSYSFHSCTPTQISILTQTGSVKWRCCTSLKIVSTYNIYASTIWPVGAIHESPVKMRILQQNYI